MPSTRRAGPDSATSDASPSTSAPGAPPPGLTLRFRNVARYVRDVEANVPLYEALGFSVARRAGDLVGMEHADGLPLVLHRWDERPANLLDTAIGFTISGDLESLRAHLAAAGWKVLREPHASDVGYFVIFGDLDGNPINLVGKPRSQAPPAGTVRLVMVDGEAKALPA